MASWGLLSRRSALKPIRSRNHKKQELFHRRLRRSLRIEQFEERALLSIGAWTPLGPAPIDYGQTENVGPLDLQGQYLNEVVGAITTVAAHPTNANILYIGTANGGIWRTTNATSSSPTWTPLTDQLNSLSIGALSFDPTDPTGQRLIAGVGRFSEYNRVGGPLTGLLYTDDGGLTWSVIDGGGLLTNKNVISVAIRGQTILVAVDNATSGLYTDVGIFRSTDGGATFTQISNGNGSQTGLPAGIAYDLAADPTNPNTFYAAIVGNGQVTTANGIYKSTDAGATWTKVSNNAINSLLISTGVNTTHRVQIAVGQAGQIYVGILNQLSGSTTQDQIVGVFRSANGGTNWTAMDVPKVTVNGAQQQLRFERIQPVAGDPLATLPSGQGAVHFSIVADPTNANIVYIGADTQVSVGANAQYGAQDYTGLLFRSDASKSAGSQWVHLTHSRTLGPTGGGTQNGSAPHAESREMIFDSAGRLIEVDDGGIYLRTSPRDNTGDWFSLNGNLQIAEVHDIAYDSISNIAIGGLHDVGVAEQIAAGGLIWREVTKGNGGDVAIDEVSLAAQNQSYRYSSGTFLADFTRRIVDANNNVVSTATPALLVLGTTNRTFYQVDGGQFRTPIAINNVDPSRILLGGTTSIFESFNRGESLANLNAVGNATALVYGGYLNGAGNASVIWAASANGVYLRTTAGGALTRTNYAGATALDIAVDPNDYRRAFVVDGTRVWYTVNSGTTWIDITGALANPAGLRAVEFLPSGSTGAVIIGTIDGVYYCDLRTIGTWKELGAELPNAPIYDMEYDARDNVLVVGTLGRGAWQLQNPRTEIFGELHLLSVSTNTTTYQASESPTISVAPTEMILRFNDTTISADTLSGILITRAGANGTFYDPVSNPYDTDDVVVYPGLITIGTNANEVLIRFAESLPDDYYRITIVGQGSDNTHYYYAPDGRLLKPFTNSVGTVVGYGEQLGTDGQTYWDGQNFYWNFTLNLGPQVTGVVAQPITRSGSTLSQSRNTIEVYFSDDMNPTSAQTLTYYTLIVTRDTANTNDDVAINPTAAIYDAAARKVTLVFAQDAVGNPITDLAQIATGAFRLRIGDQYRPIVTTERTDAQESSTLLDIAGTFAGAADLGSFTYAGDPLTGQTWVLSGQISPVYYDILWPGGRNTPGVRDLPEGATDVASESHTDPNSGDVGPYGEIATIYYNFQDVYAIIQNNPAHNLISEVQKQRVRELVSIISQYCGIQFVETADQGFTVAVGDLRAFDPEYIPGPGTPAGMAGGGLALVNSYYNWGNSEFGGSFMQVMMHEFMHLLDVKHSYELPAFEIMGSSETIDTIYSDPEVSFPGNNDISVLQYLYRKDSLDIDMYRFQVETEGDLTVETLAQRLQNASLLNTSLVLYDSQYNVIATNDDYFDDDSRVSVHLGPGTYYVGISASGNSQYRTDGDGGNTEGAYQLRLTFNPRVDQQLRGAGGAALDGDADGRAGGNFNFWFSVQSAANTVIVDKLASSGGNGSLANPYNTVSSALTAATAKYAALTPAQIQAGEGVIVRLTANNFANDNNGNSIRAVAGNLLVDGTKFTISDANRTFTFELDSNGSVTTGNIRVAFKSTDTAATVAAALAAAINSVSWIPNGLSAANPTRYAQGLYVSAAVDPTATDIVKLTGPVVTISLGQTALKSTLQDNIAYEIGRNPLNVALADGTKFEVPKGVAVIVDAGAVIKLEGANIEIGSSTSAIDRSLGSLQIMGTANNKVYITSYLDERVGNDTYANTTTPTAGNWGGIVFRNDFDYDEQAANPSRRVLEQEGIFLNYVNQADIRYGGGKVSVSGIPTVFNPIHMTEARPTVAFSTIRYSADAAMSADPNSLLESYFHDGFGESLFMADYDRVGPALHGNIVKNNSLNALFLRVSTPAGASTQQLEVSARFDDVDIVLAIPESLVIKGDAGGAYEVAGTCPLLADGRNALLVPEAQKDVNPFVDRQYFYINDGLRTVRFEFDLANNGVTTGSVRIGLPLAVQDRELTAQAITAAINGAGMRVTATADGARVLLEGMTIELRGLTYTQARLGGRLSIDSGAIVKLGGARIEVGVGAQFIAEGYDGYPVVFTSLLDDTYGAGGAFDTTGNGTAQTAAAGDWGGFYFNPTSRGSFDETKILYAGGNVAIEGGFANFTPIDIRQATVRVVNSLFQYNTAGTSGDRNGRGAVEQPGLIHVRFAQPVIAGNTFLDNLAPLISIDVNSLNALNVSDWGRATGLTDAFTQYGDNFGPLVRDNRMKNNSINGMVVRGGTLTTEGIWDDTDIVHVVYEEIIVPDITVYGGLRLQSSATQSLVVKFGNANAGLTTYGRPLEIEDRIGGTIHIIGTPGHNVILTALADDTAGAGLTPDDFTVFDTDNTAGTPQPGAWRSIQINEFSNDRNVAVINEAEAASGLLSDANSSPETAQWLGYLAKENEGGDDVLRMGFEVHGSIALDRPGDADVYSFVGYAGSRVWIQIDRTSFALDSILELIDADGNVIARSDNWREETNSSTTLFSDDWGYEDVYSINPRDAGMSVILPGPAGLQRTYYVRVSSAAPANPGDYQTNGLYQLQIRLQKVYEHPGSTIRYADIRYAAVGIEVYGQPGHSPLTADIYETEAPDNPTVVTNNTFATAQAIGNLLATDQGAITVAGFLNDYRDVDWYKLTLDYGDSIQRIPGFTSEGSVYPVVFDIDYADGLVRPDTTLWIFDETGTLILMGTDSGVVDDQPDPTMGTNLDDLSRGSVGKRDPFIGPVYLLEGHTYYIAVTSTGATAAALTDPMLRWEPIDSIRRIAEDNIGSQNASGLYPDPPYVLFPGSTALELNLSAVPYILSDVTFYILTDSNVLTVDPFTGAIETTYGATPGAYTNGDLVMLSDGRLYLITRGATSASDDQNAAAGRLRQLSIEDASLVLSDVDDGIITYRYSTTDPFPALEVAGDNSPLNEAGGVKMESLVWCAALNGWLATGNALNGYGEVRYQSNLLYLLTADGTAVDPPGVANDGTPRLPTNIIPIAQLSTGPVIVCADATNATDPANDVLDGTRFTVTDKDGTAITFELDCGLDVDMGAGALIVRDGMTFSIGTSMADRRTFEFDSGPVLIFGADVGGSLDGKTFTITDNAATPVATTFEFDIDGTTTSGNTIIKINTDDTADIIATAVVNAINGMTGGVIKAALGQATTDEARVSLINDSPTVLPVGDGLLRVEGRYGLVDPASGNILIAFEETWDNTLFQSILTAAPYNYPSLFGEHIAAIVEANVPGIDASAAKRLNGDERITFNGARVHNFAGMDNPATPGPDPIWTLRRGFDHGAGAPWSAEGLQNAADPYIVIDFGAADTARDLAVKIAAAINQAGFLVKATAEGDNVDLNYASLTDLPVVDAPLTTFGSGPGGMITGMAFLGDRLYAVTDTGGFFEVENYTVPNFMTWPDISDPNDTHQPNEIQPIPGADGAKLRFIGVVESDQNPGQGVVFAGLTLGPEQVENAKFASTFFAISRTGDVYALKVNDQGTPDDTSDDTVDKQGIFLDAKTSITIPGMTAVSGLAFSTLDCNLWHVTNRRADDDGHDTNATYDYSRVGPPPDQRAELPKGGLSFYFGNEVNVDGFTGDAGTPVGTYNAPGGAYGSLVTQQFSLVGYSKEDVPTLYFEYFLDIGGPQHRDSARVFASIDGVNWYVLGATLDNPSGNLLDTNGQWRQLVLAPPEDPWQKDAQGNTVYYYSLADFCGYSTVQLRFDFSTAGDMHVGDTGNSLETTGAFLQALAGDYLEDGDTFTVDGVEFEFDIGVALRLPNVAGDAIADGETFTVLVRDGGGDLVPLATFEFDTDGVTDPANIAIAIESGQTTTQVGRLVVEAINAAGLVNSTGDAIIADLFDNRVMLNFAEGLEQSANPTIEAVGNGYGRTRHHATPVQITSMMTANEVAEILGDRFDDVFAGGAESFRVQGSIVRMIGHPVTDAGPLPYSNSLPGDHSTDWSDGFNSIERGQDNNHEGFYLDNIIIGFAERGQMATQAPANTNFNFTAEAPKTVISTGYYQLQIRRASEYAVWTPDATYPMVLTDSFDVNDRLNQSYTLTIPAANDISHGSTLVISDGAKTVTFQFLDETVPSGNPDYVPIYFSVNQTAAEVAAAVAKAINAAKGEGMFSVTATYVFGSDRVDLFRAARVGSDGGDPKLIDQYSSGTLNPQSEGKLNFDLDTSAFVGLLDATPTGTQYMIFDDWGGTWYDAEKVPPDSAFPPGTGDDFMCWAASASNILAWTGWGIVDGMYDADAIFKYFQDHWTDEGGWQNVAWTWWFNGTNIAAGWGAAEVDVPGGAFYHRLDPDNYIVTEYDDADVMKAIDDFLHAGYGVGVGIYNEDYTTAHAITVWGFNYDDADPNHYVGVWVTDSDDNKSNPHAPDVLHYYEVQWSQSEGRWYLQDYYGRDDIYISYVAGLAKKSTGVIPTRYNEQGDFNRVYDQGQLIIENNIISRSSQVGILVVATVTDIDGVATPKPGPTSPLAELNIRHQVPGVVIQNNVVAFSGQVGIYVAGDIPDAGQSLCAVPFARIVNNTIYGIGTTAQNFGIIVGPYASPTILNNVVANTQTGIGVDYRSTTTVIGTTVYSGNQTNLLGNVTETFAMVIPVGDPLFVDAAAGNFYPAAGSRIIDSALDSLQDRANMVVVRNPIGLAPSPIITPSVDALGQLRIDDPSVAPPQGFGLNTFKDRGAIDRVDFVGPWAVLVEPLDNDAAGLDRDPATGDLILAIAGSMVIPRFVIRMDDAGAGVAAYTVTSSNVRVYRDDEELVDGKDYFFSYDSATKRIFIRSAGAAWAPGHVYKIVLSDQIRDLAGNSVQLNHLDGTTSFTIRLTGYDFGDAPMFTDAGHSTSATTLPSGARHIIDPAVYLGSGISTEPNAVINTAATADDMDDGVVFLGGMYAISTASGTAATKTISVTASVDGVLDAWIDWNNDGVWDASEKIAFRDGDGNPVAQIHAGTNQLTFDVPVGLTAGGTFETYARFRFSTTGLLSDGTAMQPTGEALDGEVEDYRIAVVPYLADWGDAPDPTYPTLESSNGASHLTGDTPLYLGETVTLDLAPNANATASGDEGDDGIVNFSALEWVQGRDVELSIYVTNHTAHQAYLNAWIDFNGDGAWSVGEQVISGLAVHDGLNTVTISVPLTATLGDTFARFRLSTEQSLLPTGAAPDGEVEDYMLTILPPRGEIAGTVWNDHDASGVRNGDETPLAGWTVYIDANLNGQLDAGERSVVTAADGSYIFDNLAPGNYRVREVLPVGWQLVAPALGYRTVNVVSAQTTFDVDLFNVDILDPTVVSITRGDGVNPALNPTNAATVYYVVRFSEAVMGVDVGDFTLTTTGIVGASVTNVTGANDTYVVTVNTGTGDGTLRLNLFDNDTITDLSFRKLNGTGTGSVFNGEVYTIDKTPPRVASLTRVTNNPTNAYGVTFEVVFTEDVFNVDADDFQLLASGLTNATISEVVGAGTTWQIGVVTGDGDFGTLQLNLVDNDTILDAAGNALAAVGGNDGSFTGPIFTIDRIAPTVVSIVRAGVNPTYLTQVVYTVTFSEDVTGVNAADFVILPVGMVSPSIAGVTGSGRVYTVTVNTGAGGNTTPGTLQLKLVDDDSIRDLAGNFLAGVVDGLPTPIGDFLGEIYTIDRRNPTALNLSNTRVVDGAPVNTIVGALTSAGPHAGLYTYELVSGTGSDDNALFRIVGDHLQTNFLPDFSSKASYKIRLRTTDSMGMWLEKEFIITVEQLANTATIGNLVWKDGNGNGLQDAGEAGIAGAVVELFCSPTGAIGGTLDYSIGQTVANASGVYQFANVLSGLSYYLVVRAPVGYTFTTANVGANDLIDSDFNASGVGPLFTLAAGETNNTFDAGLVGTAAAYNFALRAGSTGDDQGLSVTTDAAGNVYVSGLFRGTVDFDPSAGVYNLTSAGSSDAFVAKYTSNGTLLWAMAFGGVGDDAANAVAIGADGFVYVGGYFSSTADFLSGAGTYNLTSAGAKDAFIAKLDSRGRLVWARGMGGVGDEAVNSLSIGPDGGIYSTGFFATAATGTLVDFNPGTGVNNLVSIGPKDIFVSKLNAEGEYVWAKRMGGIGWSQGMSVGAAIVATAGGLYLTGSFQGVADFDPGAGEATLACAGDTDAFVVKLTTDGNYVWAKQFGGPLEVYGASLALSPDGSAVYIHGGFQGAVDFDPGAGVYSIDSGANRRMFVTKLTTATGNFVWADGFGGSGWDRAGGIAVGSDGGVFVVGGFFGTGDFDPGTGVFNLTSTGQKDAFLLRLNPNGGFVGAYRLGNSGDDYAAAVAAYNGTIFVTGYFQGTVDLDPSAAVYSLSSAGGQDAFLGKYSMPATPLTVTINQASSQSDPTVAAKAVFRVVFSAAVSDFTAEDVTVGGTALGPYNVAVTPVGSAGTTYDVTITGMTSRGTIVATLAGNVAHDAFNTGNQASTSTDNVVTYSPKVGMYFTSVFAGEALSGSDQDLVLETSDYLMVTCTLYTDNPVVSRTFKLDGKTIAAEMMGRTGPDAYGNYSYWHRLSPQAVGTHTYQIVMTDSKGNTITHEGSFYVTAGSANPQPPAGPSISFFDTQEAVAGSNGNKILESSDRLLFTWVVNYGNPVNPPTIKIDGKAPVSPIYGKIDNFDYYRSYYCSVAPLSAGKHSYEISVADSTGKTSIRKGTLIIVAGLMIDGEAVLNGAAALLHAEQAEAIAAAARQRLSAAYGQRASILDNVSVEVTDLGGELLGLAADGKIYIDDDAAGRGWFIDNTPWDDAEFERLASGVLSARVGSGAEGRADLLTTVMHEMSHLLGFEHSDDPAGLMSAAMPLGQRRLPEEEPMQPATVAAPRRAAVGNSVMDYLFASLEEEGQRKWSLLGRSY
jgi:hypothetical protein